MCTSRPLHVFCHTPLRSQHLSGEQIEYIYKHRPSNGIRKTAPITLDFQKSIDGYRYSKSRTCSINKLLSGQERQAAIMSTIRLVTEPGSLSSLFSLPLVTSFHFTGHKHWPCDLLLIEHRLKIQFTAQYFISSRAII